MIKSLFFKTKNFFITGHERSLAAKKNIVISLLIKGLTIMLTLIIVPLTINYINASQYGLWLTLSSMVAWFNFLDIGLANGLKNKIAEANALGKSKDVKAYISTTYAILTLISISMFLAILTINIFLNWNKILNISTTEVSNLNLIALIIECAFCLQFVLQIISSVVTAFHASAKASIIIAI